MVKLVKVKSSYGHDCVVNIDRLDAIIYRPDGDADIYVGTTHIVVPHEQARKLQKSIDPLA